MSDQNMQMDDNEILRATFFSSEEEVQALKDQDEAKRAAKLMQQQRRRRASQEFRDLARFVRCLEALPHDHRRANILWLADKYLGLKLRG